MPTCTLMANNNRGLWLTGLGVLAIPISLLEALRETVEKVSVRGRALTCYTESKCVFNPCAGVHQWLSEDYNLTKRLGGAHLFTDLSFAHNKTMPLSPSPNTIEQLKNYMLKG
jgi:hypothetical protein